ncbi:MAG TPA: hypothetical protein VE843_10335 [Ktedonobacteraceae bacterium]|nr:hypothetical protein [Ktedonobacteraceae bacterium]
MRQNKSWQKFAIGLILLMSCFLLTACTFTQTAFSRTANNAGSAFAAAEATILYAHQGKITYSYAASSFINYQSELSGTDQTLAAQGAADRRTLQRLLALYSPAMQVVDNPCLSTVCNWRKQIEILNRASQAFLEAGSS